jgi:GNAT superfamily N-acetyltransferase
MPWDGVRLRLICNEPACHGDRPRPSPIQVREGDEHDRLALMDVSRRFFGSSRIHVFDEVFPLARTPFLVVEFGGERAGFLAYALNFPAKDEAAVVLLVVQPGFQGRGVGRALQGALEAVCRPRGVTRIRISSSNDNIPSLYFYQRIGYVLENINFGAAAAALSEHGDEGMLGFGGIPIRDEIDLVKEIGPLEQES